MTNTARTFLVGLQGENGINPHVFIREVQPDSCSFPLSREDAWTLARKIAQPLNVRGGRKHGLLNIHFTNLDGMTIDLGPADGSKPAAKPAPKVEVLPTGTVVLPNSVVTPSGNVVAAAPVKEYEWLKAENTEGNDFLTSLKGQLERKGSLSDKQRECIAKAMKPKAEQPKVDVPAGHYAVDGEDGTLKFYRLDKPTEGRWEGYTFLKVQASDDFFPVKGAAKTSIIAKIAADVRGALIRYGQELGKCGVCNRTLTDDESRAKGIGPICEAAL